MSIREGLKKKNWWKIPLKRGGEHIQTSHCRSPQKIEQHYFESGHKVQKLQNTATEARGQVSKA